MQPDLVVARRAWQIMESMATPLLVDLALLALHARHQKDVYSAAVGKQILHHIRQLKTLQALQSMDGTQQAMNSIVTRDSSGTDTLNPGLLWCPSQGIGNIADTLRVLDIELSSMKAEGTLKMQAPLTPAQHLCLRFRACKKLVLFDIVYNAIVQHQEN